MKGMWALTWSPQQATSCFMKLPNPLGPASVSYPPYPLISKCSCDSYSLLSLRLEHSSSFSLFDSLLCILKLSAEMSLPIRKRFLIPSLGSCSCYVLPETVLRSNSYALPQANLTPQPPAALAFMLLQDRNPIYLAPHWIPITQPIAWI